MIVTQSTLEKAISRIFREQHMQAYSSMPFRELRGFWAYTGLRDSDLRDAVRYMFEQNHLDFQNDGQGLAVVITPQGAAELNSAEFSLGSVVRDSRDKLNLRQAGKRLTASATMIAKTAHMRSEDQAAVRH